MALVLLKVDLVAIKVVSSAAAVKADIVRVETVLVVAMVATLVIHLVDQAVKYLQRLHSSMHQTVAINTELFVTSYSCIWFLFLRLKL